MAVNSRLIEGNVTEIDLVAQRESVKAEQFPKAVVLSCLDSRIPLEILFDQSFGYIFVRRVAGNIENVNQLVSMEFATKLAGAELIPMRKSNW